MAWTWLGILAWVVADWGRELVKGLLRQRGPEPGAGAVVAQYVIAAVLAAGMLAPSLVVLSERHAAIDMSHDASAARWVDLALAEMEPGAVVVSWWSYSTPLWYAQRLEGRRPDLVVIDDRTRLDKGLGDFTTVIDAHLGKEPVYVIRDDPDEVELIAARYEIEPMDGVDARSLTRVIGLREPGS